MGSGAALFATLALLVVGGFSLRVSAKRGRTKPRSRGVEPARQAKVALPDDGQRGEHEADGGEPVPASEKVPASAVPNLPDLLEAIFFRAHSAQRRMIEEQDVEAAALELTEELRAPQQPPSAAFHLCPELRGA